VNLVVYGDFSSPDSYLASRRVDALTAAGVVVEWRAVERSPLVPVSGRRLLAAEQDALADRFAALDGLLLPGETLPWSMPAIVPKTEAAVSAYAATESGDDVRRLLFELYWLHGADIGNPAVLRTPLTGPILRAGSDAAPLRESGYAVSVDRGPITTAAYRRIRCWRTEWQQLGSLRLPVLLVGGATLSGIDALRRLGKEITYAAAAVQPELDDPRRYPQVTVRPPAAWVSQIGGRWRNVYRRNGVD
jgi:2-hydroxychromene-2-carboxylate isomerase